jgi:hypothetical protein
MGCHQLWILMGSPQSTSFPVTIKIVTADDAHGVHEFVTHLSAFLQLLFIPLPSTSPFGCMPHLAPCSSPLTTSCALHPTNEQTRALHMPPAPPHLLPFQYHLWHYWDSPRHSTALRVFRPSSPVAIRPRIMVRATQNTLCVSHGRGDCHANVAPAFLDLRFCCVCLPWSLWEEVRSQARTITPLPQLRPYTRRLTYIDTVPEKARAE